MQHPDELTGLALRARHGDAAAANEFVRATQPDVWRLCAFLASSTQADDLTQDTYARAFGSLHRFAGRSTARTWLLSIARHACADAVRASQRSRRLSPVSDQPPAGVSTDHAGLVAARDLIRELDPLRREAFVLTQVLGLSYAEAADVADCPVGTIRSRVARARADLVDAMRDARADPRDAGAGG